MSLNQNIFLNELSKLENKEPGDPLDEKQLKQLLLVLAGDKKTIEKLSLEDMAALFNSSVDLLSFLEEQEPYMDVTKLTALAKNRRAL